MSGTGFSSSFCSKQKNKLKKIIPQLTAKFLSRSHRDGEPGGVGPGGAGLQDAVSGWMPRFYARPDANLLEERARGEAHIWVPAGLPGGLLHLHGASVPAGREPVDVHIQVLMRNADLGEPNQPSFRMKLVFMLLSDQLPLRSTWRRLHIHPNPNTSPNSPQPSNKILHRFCHLGPDSPQYWCGAPPSFLLGRRQSQSSSSFGINNSSKPTQSGILRFEHHDYQNSLTQILTMGAELISSAHPTSRETLVPFLGRCGIFSIYSVVKVGRVVGPWTFVHLKSAFLLYFLPGFVFRFYRFRSTRIFQDIFCD